MQNLLEGHSHTKFRKGIGEYCICVKCNSITGGWYGVAFADWTRQGFEWFEKLSAKDALILPYFIRPLNVIKQVLVMALAMSSERTLEYHRELRRFVLNREQKYLPPKYRVHAYFNVDGQPRFASGMAIMRTDVNRASYVEAEVALPPFGYCVSTIVKDAKSLAEYQGLCDITWFARYDYNIWTRVSVCLPAKETHEPLPLDYRSRSEIEAHNEANQI